MPDPSPDHLPSEVERSAAREFKFYLIAGFLMLSGFLLLWTSALDNGGFWWVFTAIAFVVGTFVGERVRKRVVVLVRISRDSRNAPKE